MEGIQPKIHLKSVVPKSIGSAKLPPGHSTVYIYRWQLYIFRQVLTNSSPLGHRLASGRLLLNCNKQVAVILLMPKCHAAQNFMCGTVHCTTICKSGRCSTVLRRGGTLWNAWNTCPVPEQCGMVWNGMEWVCLDNTCHPLSPPVNPRNGKILNWS